MNYKTLLTAILASILLISSATPPAFAYFDAHQEMVKETGKPLGYLVAPDGRQTPVYLIPNDWFETEGALRSGLVTESEVASARAWEKMAMIEGVGVCPFWTGSPATMISEGWDYDSDWYEDYEHPVGWTNNVVCVTTWYYLTKGFPAEEFHNDYKPGIARHRLKVGLSGFPSWFAAAQTTMRWQ